MSRVIACLSLLLSLNVEAQPWEFDVPLTIAGSANTDYFHHLESSGRRNIAVSADTVAVAWEDDRDGTPRIYLARKHLNDKTFSREDRISGEGEAYEPSLLALTHNRFVVAWEEDGHVYTRLLTSNQTGPSLRVADNATQASLAADGDQVLLVYSKREARFGRIVFQRFNIDGVRLLTKQVCAVDAEPVKDDQLYPSLVNLKKSILVAWEDRRPGHTIIMAAQSDNKSACVFSPPQRISEDIPGQNTEFGRGHGVSRVALAAYGDDQALAVWADKRDFREGYDIYGAHYPSGNTQLFGRNIRVQDSFGGVAQQWHATATGDAFGRLVVAWDDNRDGDGNIMLSWLKDGDWSEDLAVPGASGAGEQNHPAIMFDADGNLHVAWVEREIQNGPTRLRYVSGRLLSAD